MQNLQHLAYSERNSLALIIEDNKVTQVIHKKILVSLGYSVDIASDAQTAMKMLEKSYKLILLDIVLPDKNGVELAKEIRFQNKAATDLTIIGITAYLSKCMQCKCLGAGIDAVLSKPLILDKLQQVLALNKIEKPSLMEDEAIDNPKLARLIKKNLMEEYYPIAIQKASKPSNMSQSQYVNYLAIHILEETGNEFPTQKAINFVESLLKYHFKKIEKNKILEKQKNNSPSIFSNEDNTILNMEEAECSVHILEEKSAQGIADTLKIPLKKVHEIIRQLETKLKCDSMDSLREKLKERIDF